MSTFKLSVTPIRSALSAAASREFDVLVRVAAPAEAPSGAKRPPLNLQLVIDRSGSMSGQPLEEARRCASFVIDNLAAGDYASLVTYDHQVDVLVPSQAAGSKQAFHQAISSIHSGGSTALHAGWQQGAELARVHPLEQGVNRVILLSDGCANAGLQDTDSIAAQCKAYALEGISTSTYGLSHHFNELLMTEMAKAGRGNSYYGETADDLMDPFREEFDLLTSLCARNLRLQFETAAGIQVRVLNRFGRTGSGEWLLPDLAYGGEAWAVLRLQFDNRWAAKLPGATEFVLQAMVKQTQIAADGTASERALEAKLEIPLVSAAEFGRLVDDEVVRARRDELLFADVQEQASYAARSGDWAGVESLLAQMDTLAGNNSWLRESLQNTRRYARQRKQENFAKEASYHSHRLRTRLASHNEAPAACYSEDAELDKASFLRRKREQGKRM